MTIEEKAKAYDEALEWMREVYPTLTGADKEDAEHFFPELKESEDERIRKSIIKLLQQGGYMSTADKTKAFAWLEKQKENPKLSDSIPTDCMLDAKCEDRWHKVADSMPDNPREVLCKDEAGNYFIGRYYVGEGWEISNYDDEDKPHHLNPPVSKWIDFPLEKQKEQKPVEWSEVELEFRGEKVKVKRPFYRDDNGRGYSTTEQDEEVSWNALRDWCEKKGVSLYDLYPRTEWSEEDEKMLEGTLMWLDDLEKQGEYVEKERSWLKSLRPSKK